MNKNNTLVILVVLVMTSGCYTKKQSIRKFCTPSTFDTVVVESDTLVIDSSYTDTVFSSKVDSIYIRDGKLSIKYIRVHDSVYLSGKYEQDTLIRTDTVNISIPIKAYLPEKSKLSMFKDYWYWLLLAFVVGLISPVFFKR